LEGNETGISGALVVLNNLGAAVSADANGKYTAFFKQNDVLTVVKPGTSCSIAPLVYPLSNSVAGLDFGIYCNSAQPNIGLRLIPFGIFRPGFENLFALVIFNRGTSTESGTVALSYVDSLLQFLDASVQPISVQTGNLQWSFSNLKPYETRNIVVRFFTKTKAIPGTNFTFYAAFSPLPSDVDLNDNQETLYLRILGSFDPNDKSVLPETYHLDQFVSGMPLRYTIRFQNTGNYPADFVVVLDTLAPGLDLGTLRVVGASHPFKWSMQAPRTLQFRFDAIHLPDSASNALKSQGFVQFEIRPTNNFHVYDTVFNRASIYFDFNPPVHTNQVATVLYPSTAIYTPNGVPEALQIWPNPAQDQLHVTGEFTDKNVFIYNSFGQLMEQIQPRGSALTLEISQWNPGIYLLVCGTQHIRFIIH
jgi:hypothetical protein